MRSGSAGDAGALQALFSNIPGNAERVVIPINGCTFGAHDGSPAFYCVHSLSGAAGTDFSVLARLMPDVRFYGVQAPAAKMQDAEFGGSIEAIGDYYACALVLSQPEGPILLGGWSAGVTIGLETAENLRARGRKVGLFVAIDAAPENTGANLPAWHPRYILEVLSNLRGWVTHDLLMQQHPLQSLFRQMAALGKAAMDCSGDAKNAASNAVERFMQLSRYPPYQWSFMLRLYSALIAHKSKKYFGRVVVYEASVKPLFKLPQVGRVWRSLAPQSIVVSVEGTHSSILREPNANILADDLRKRIAEIAAYHVVSGCRVVSP